MARARERLTLLGAPLGAPRTGTLGSLAVVAASRGALIGASRGALFAARNREARGQEGAPVPGLVETPAGEGEGDAL